MTDSIFVAAMESIKDGDAEKAAEAARQGLHEGIAPLELMNNGFIPGIKAVGDLFEDGKLFIPQLILCAEAMEKATAIINAAFASGQEAAKGKVVIGTVQGDVHDIGKTIVVALLKANGFDVHDLGRDVPIAAFIEEAEKFGADVIGTSTLLTTTMAVQKELEEVLQKSGLKGKYKTIVGGAVVTQRWAKDIGADAFAVDASDGVKKIKQLLVKPA